MQASDGNLYGTTTKGGANSNAGTVYKITTAGAETVMWSFGGSGDGVNPYASPIQASDGNLYGTTYGGGANGAGTVFKITTAGAETVLWSFGGSGDGALPDSGLMQASDGNLYGTTTSGGTNGAGTVFKITTAGAETVLWSFGGSGDGAKPYGGLIQASDGNLYGTTYGGGANGAGTVFKITTTGAETVLWSFGGSGDGVNLDGALMQASDGNLYGTTYGGGANGAGTVFNIQ